MMTPDELKAKILADAKQSPSATRGEGARRAGLLLITGLAVAVSIFVAVGGLSHGAGRPTWFLVATLIGWTCVAAWAMHGALRRGKAMLGSPRPYLIAVVCATPILLFAFMLVVNVIYPESLTAFPGRLGLKCLFLTLAMALWPLVAIVIARRASDPVHPVATGAALGAASGAWAGVLTDLWCPAAYPSHIALGHVLPILILSIVGAFLGKRVLAMRPSTTNLRR
jgi:hypothetical protein